MEWMIRPYRRYFDFRGRSARKEFWMFMLLWLIVYFVIFMVMFAVADLRAGVSPDEKARGAGPAILAISLLGLFFLASFIPMLALQVRRLHDQDKSGWFLLFTFVPYVGSLVVLVFMCLPGTEGENRFGQDPKGIGDAGVFA